MSKTPIPEQVKLRLWGKAAGRCEYRGCRTPLWLDTLTKAEFNTAYVAHVYADSAEGPRGDTAKSALLASDISNLMLMCDEHHRLIDRGDVAGHPPEALFAMKREHEERMELLGGITPELRSEVVLYGAKVGEHGAHVTMQQAAAAMLPERYPATARGHLLGLKNSEATEHDYRFWQLERAQLEGAFNRFVRPALDDGQPHVSVFALAPQPLLVLLGSLLCDMRTADVYQFHREPSATWRWDDTSSTEYELDIVPPATRGSAVAAVFELSASVDQERVRGVIGDDVSIWSLRLKDPGNDRLRTSAHLGVFRTKARQLLADINLAHPKLAQLEVFPVMPVAAAVELGRIHMPKADVPLALWDELRETGGFRRAFKIP